MSHTPPKQKPMNPTPPVREVALTAERTLPLVMNTHKPPPPLPPSPVKEKKP
jgi:hypothetical protein